MKRLKDKVAIVTGASEGIGQQVSAAFAREGARVALLSRDPRKLTAAADAINAECPNAARAIPCDVGSTAQMQAAVAEALAAFGGRIDILVNNAALAIPGDITEDSDAEWNFLLNINLLGVFRGIKFTLPHMLRQQSGSIINMASVQGDRAWDHWTTYAAAKGAMKAATRQLAGQYGHSGVRFNCISPGAIDTPLNRKRLEAEGPEFYEANKRMHALGRMGQADEVNGACIFLASDESKFVTGIDLPVDGGLLVLPRN